MGVKIWSVADLKFKYASVSLVSAVAVCFFFSGFLPVLAVHLHLHASAYSGAVVRYDFT